MNFVYRLLVGSSLTLLSIVLILISHGPWTQWLFFAGFTILLHIALWELYGMMGKSPHKKTGMVFSFLFSLGVFLVCPPLAEASLLGLGLTAFFPYMRGARGPIEGISKTLSPFAYLTLPFATGLLLNNLSSLWLLFAIGVAKMADIGGYFGGKAWGKTPLAEKISPRKTVEGALSGLLLGTGTALLFLFLSPAFTFLPCLLLGIAVSLLAQYGDLSESLLKRDAQVKDSGRIPGVGGMLDVVDSLVFTLPFVYIYVQIMERI